ncbi:DUF7556 family protein [Natrarchaeobius chitinivorans]|uniref:DUF7556 family protein n=1 Tax=Natrarchaeobius chitinivorans TaxID=1679083 RepID=UPI0014053CDF|nr:hypothetical protein [Natrarchaeobius chitinivorans]
MVAHPQPVEEGAATSRDVAGAIDEINGTPHLVIADLTRDDCWLSMATADAVSLENCR